MPKHHRLLYLFSPKHGWYWSLEMQCVLYSKTWLILKSWNAVCTILCQAESVNNKAHYMVTAWSHHGIWLTDALHRFTRGVYQSVRWRDGTRLLLLFVENWICWKIWTRPETSWIIQNLNNTGSNYWGFSVLLSWSDLYCFLFCFFLLLASSLVFICL